MRCNLCFKEKPNLAQPIPKFPAVVCKGCFYEIDRVIGFLAHYGCGIQMGTPETPPTPPKARKSPASKSGGKIGKTISLPLD